MDEELRNAAQDLLEAYDGKCFVRTIHPNIEALRAALAKNANAAPQDQDAKDAVPSGVTCLSFGTLDQVLKDAARFRYIAEHWETGRESYTKAGKFKSLTLLIQANFKGCSQDGLSRIIDAAMKEQKP